MGRPQAGVPSSLMGSALRLLHLAAVVVLPWCYGGAFDVSRYALAALLSALTAVWVWKRTGLDAPVAHSIACLLSWALLQATATTSPVQALESAAVLAGVLAAVVVWRHDGRDETRARALAYAVLVSAAAQGFFGVIQASLATRTLYGRASEHLASPFGSFENHNHFAGMLEMAAVLALALAFGRAERAGGPDPWSIGFGGLSLGLAGAHLASRSRGGLIALIAGGLAVVLLWRLTIVRRSAARRDWAVAAVMLVALLAFGWTAVPATTRAHLATAFQGPTDASGSYRLSLGAATLRLWLDNPLFGCGLGNYADDVTRFKRADGSIRAGHAESDVLEFLAEGGLAGVALLAWLGITVARGFLDRVREGRDPWRKSLAVGSAAAVIALIAHSFLDFNLRIPSNALIFSALLGLAAAPRSEPPPASALLRRMLAGMFLVMAAWALWRTVGALELRAARKVTTPHERLGRMTAVLSRHPYLSEAWRERSHLRWALARGDREVHAYRLRGATEDMEQVLRLRPHMSHAWADLGWLRHLQADPAGARLAFDRAAELDPAGVAVGLARVEFFARLGRPAEAREELGRIRRYNPDWPATSAEAAARRLGIETFK